MVDHNKNAFGHLQKKLIGFYGTSIPHLLSRELKKHVLKNTNSVVLEMELWEWIWDEIRVSKETSGDFSNVRSAVGGDFHLMGEPSVVYRFQLKEDFFFPSDISTRTKPISEKLLSDIMSQKTSFS